MTELDPVAIRKALVSHRTKGTQWDEAWRDSIRAGVRYDDDRSMYRFLEKHFKAAYCTDSSPRGRCRVPEPDAHTFADPQPEESDRCRSGAGCDAVATCGKFGKHWCPVHGAELARIAKSLATARTRADPRKGGNKSLYTHKAA